ncbi:hypothetical protein JYT88_01320 [Rhodospirillaceae bacterium AH-315-P19]|nr:hypothetical protein [Rhodospirillaceae bacterium AH-315-P19]
MEDNSYTEMGILDFLENQCLKEVDYGDNPNAARVLAGLIVSGLEHESLSTAAKKWLVTALLAIAEGEDANKAFCIKGKPGRRRQGTTLRTNTRWRNVQIVRMVKQLVKDGKQPTRNRATPKKPSACSIAAKYFKLEEANIEKIYYEFLKSD